MSGVKQRILDTVSQMDALRVRSEELREGWPSIEQEVFSLLDRAKIRPSFLAYEKRPEEGHYYFRIDWIERKLTEVDFHSFVVTIDMLDSFGNLVGSENGTDENKGNADVTGIASSF